MAISRHYIATSVLAVLVLAAPGAIAADTALIIEEPEFDASPFSVNFGGTVTTNYIARGITQSGDGPAVQAYVEVGAHQFYANAFASTVSFGGVRDIEFDVAAGWRPTFEMLSFDIGYAHYMYLSDITTGFGEAYASVTVPVLETTTLGAKVYFAPNYANSATSATYLEGTVDVALPHDFGVSGGLGYQAFDAAFGPSYLNWNAGVYWAPIEGLTLDLRYTQTNLSDIDCATLATNATDCGAKVALSLTYEH